MTGHDLDHQLSGPGQQPVPAPVSHRRPGAGIAVLSTVRAGSPGWMSRGACRGEDPELFFPIATAGPALAQVRAAKVICSRCPVQPNCLSYAPVTGQDHGIWGGTTSEERWPARRRRRGLPASPR